MNEINITELMEMVSVCLDEIVRLKEENNKLKTEINDVRNTSMLLADKLRQKIDRDVESADARLSSTIVKLYEQLCNGIDNAKYEANDPEFKENLFYPRFYSIDYTIEKLCDGASMSRYGDGEFALMDNYQRQGFQKLDERLIERLREIIMVNEDDFCLGIADNYGSLEILNHDGAWGIRNYLKPAVRRSQQKWLVNERMYHNAYISRPYALYEDNNTDAPLKRFNKLRQIWEGRDVIFVEGNQTRLGYGNDLFDNAHSIRRIECPAVDAFSRYDDILAACINNGDNRTLFLIALGPTATVLAYDLFKKGYQAIDIGHLDLEYEWYKNHTGKRSVVPNKYNNEMNCQQEIEEITDEKYLSQIICNLPLN